MSGYVPIPPDKLPHMVGKGIHLTWARRGCVWRLERIEGDTLHLYTPETKKRMTAKASDALYTRAHEPKEARR
jgi:hypothetical protein